MTAAAAPVAKSLSHGYLRTGDLEFIHKGGGSVAVKSGSLSSALT